MKGSSLGLREAINLCRWPTPLPLPPSFLALSKEHSLHWLLQFWGEDKLRELQTELVETDQNNPATTNLIIKFHKGEKSQDVIFLVSSSEKSTFYYLMVKRERILLIICLSESKTNTLYSDKNYKLYEVFTFLFFAELPFFLVFGMYSLKTLLSLRRRGA